MRDLKESLFKFDMVYLYFNREKRILYVYDSLQAMGSHSFRFRWDEISSVTTNVDDGQIVAHNINEGKVIEFPIGLTLLSCKIPMNVNI